MFKLIQNIHLYAPEDKGMNDLLICGEKIACIAPHIDIRGIEVEVIDGAGMNAAPAVSTNTYISLAEADKPDISLWLLKCRLAVYWLVERLR